MAEIPFESPLNLTQRSNLSSEPATGNVKIPAKNIVKGNVIVWPQDRPCLVTRVGRQKPPGAEELVVVIHGQDVIDDTPRSPPFRLDDEVDILSKSVERYRYKLVRASLACHLCSFLFNADLKLRKNRVRLPAMRLWGPDQEQFMFEVPHHLRQLLDQLGPFSASFPTCKSASFASPASYTNE